MTAHRFKYGGFDKLNHRIANLLDSPLIHLRLTRFAATVADVLSAHSGAPAFTFSDIHVAESAKTLRTAGFFAERSLCFESLVCKI